MARPILNHFQNRLQGMVARSSLLKVRIAKHGRIIDCSQLAIVSNGLPERLLSSVIDGGGPVPMDFRLGARITDEGGVAQGPFDAATDTQEEEDIAKRHKRLFESLEKRIRRHGQLAERETGVHALWFGYPLLYVAAGSGDQLQWIFAPVFLWPISVDVDLRREGRIRVGRFREPRSSVLPPQFNRAMAIWVARQLGVHLPEPTEGALQQLNSKSLKSLLDGVGNSFQNLSSLDFDTALSAVPSGKQLTPAKSPSFYNCAVLGYFRWPNEAILADLESLKDAKQYDGPVSAFVEAERVAEPPCVAVPPEHDRFLVTQADFSQERVVWQSRFGPGLVVHGPPGTGKSQTIVNVIADALAHGRTVLMVCQKQAATRVVYERLRAAGLADLCVEVHDAEQDRLSVFKTIRNQIDQLPTTLPHEPPSPRDDLARRISGLEGELDKYSRLLHEMHPQFGLSYRQMKAWEAQAYEEFDSVRELPHLAPHVEGLGAGEVKTLCEQIATLGSLFQGDIIKSWVLLAEKEKAAYPAGVKFHSSAGPTRAGRIRHEREYDIGTWFSRTSW